MQQCYLNVFLKPVALKPPSRIPFRRDGIVGCNLLLNYFFGDSIQGPKKEENKAEKDNYEKSAERNDGHDAEVKDDQGKDDEEREMMMET